MSTTLKVPRLRGRRAEENRDTDVERGILSLHDRRRRPVRAGQVASHIFLMAGLVVVGLGPLLWLAKAAVSTTQDTIQQPFALWPSGIDWANLEQAWVEVEVGKYFFNTIWMAAGEWAVQLLVGTTGGFALSVLKPDTAGSSAVSCSPRCSCLPSCCSFRCISRCCTLRSSGTRSSTRSGRCGSRPAPARSMFCS